MNDKAKEIRNEYYREYMAEYRAKNKEKLNQKQREWRKSNPDKVQIYNKTYWEKRGKE